MSDFDKLFSFGYPSFTKDPDLYYHCIKSVFSVCLNIMLELKVLYINL